MISRARSRLDVPRQNAKSCRCRGRTGDATDKEKKQSSCDMNANGAEVGGLSKKTGRVALRMRCDEPEVARPGLAVLHMASQTLQVAPSTRFIAHLITILRRWHPCQLCEGRDGLPALASW